MPVWLLCSSKVIPFTDINHKSDINTIRLKDFFIIDLSDQIDVEKRYQS